MMLHRRDEAAFRLKRTHHRRHVLRLETLATRDSAHTSNAEVNFQFRALHCERIKRRVMYHQEGERLIDQITLVDERIAPGDDDLNACALQRPDGHLARATAPPAILRDDDGRALARPLAEFRTNIVERLLAERFRRSEVAELAGDDRISVYSVPKPLYCPTDDCARSFRMGRVGGALMNGHHRLRSRNLRDSPVALTLEDDRQPVAVYAFQQRARVAQTHVQRARGSPRGHTRPAARESANHLARRYGVHSPAAEAWRHPPLRLRGQARRWQAPPRWWCRRQ